jgi:hypothetical protein
MLKNFIIKNEQDRQVTITGLLPNTKHYVYVDSQKVSSTVLKPKNGVLGEELITSENGVLEFTYYEVFGAFTATSREQLQEINTSRELKVSTMIVSNVDTSIFGRDAELRSSSLAKGQI